MLTSDPEVITYMADDNFEILPRWAPTGQTSHLGLQSAQSTSASQYPLYTQQAPPPQQPQQPSHHDSSRLTSIANTRAPPRLGHLMDTDSHQSSQDHTSPMLNIARSASLSTSNRGRRQPDDLERAYNSEAQGPSVVNNNRQQMPNPFYPSAVAYQQAASAATVNHGQNAAADGYNMYYGTTNQPTRIKQEPTSPPPASALTLNHGQNAADGYNMYYGSTNQPSHVKQEPTSSPALSAQQMPSMDPYSQTHQQPSSSMYSSNYTDYSSQPSTGPPDTEMRSSPYIPHSSQNSVMSPQSSAYNSKSSYPSMDTHISQSQLFVTTPSRPSSHSNPATPFSMQHPQYYSSSQSDQMNVEPPVRRRSVGFQRVRDARELRPYMNSISGNRRVDLNGVYVSPLRALTTEITTTFNLCNKQFRYETAHNPRRVLTKPSRPAHNDGFDNEDYDYILYVNDYLGSEDGQKYLILDVLGQGTFGQVVKCQNTKTNEILAVKVIKNKPAYFNQSMMEVTILQMLNNDYDPRDEHHILRLRDSFIHKNHLCLVFEQLSSNLYELIKQNQFQGLSTQLVKVFTGQLLDALTVLKEARLIHCDLKPENILLKTLQSPQIKVIDFGSACHERQTVYTYIQSRFYRSPEVLLGLPYTSAIDMWSLGCIVVELFLGLPLFPGTSEYNQITRIVDLLGLPPQHMLENGKQTNQFFDRFTDAYGQTRFRLKSIEQYSRERGTQEQVGKQYFTHKTLPDIIRHAPLASSKHGSSAKQQELERESNNRAAFIDFCQGLLNMDPLTRWTPQQAKQHPFITSERFTGSFNPQRLPTPSATPVVSSVPKADPKRPYGGLVVSNPQGSKPYPDATTYNQQLAQHQAYTAQAQAVSQASANAVRNPYLAQQPTQSYNDGGTNYGSQQSQQHQAAVSQAATRQLIHQTSAGSLGLQYSQQSASSLSAAVSNPLPPSASYYPSTRGRANTINQMDVVPPALARLQQMSGSDATGIGRNALTPVMQRDDAMREWERRQSGKAHPPPQTYPQLEYLQQQAELAAASGMNWSTATSARPYQPSSLAYQSQPVSSEQDRVNATMRDAVMSSVRNAARQEPSSNSLSQAGIISAPPQAYTGVTTTGATTAPNRFATTAYPPNATSYDSSLYDNRNEAAGSLYLPIQTQQFPSYSSNTVGSLSHPQQQQSSRLNLPQSPTASSTSFYGAGVVPSGQPFASNQGSPNPPQQGLPKDSRRTSGMDVWQR